MLVDYAYLSNTKKLKDFIEGIPTRTVPDKVTQKYLEKAGFKGKGDRLIIKVLKFIGFLNDKGLPTEMYSGYRDSTKQKGIMATCLKRAYASLFDLYPNPCQRDTEALTNFFRTESGLGEGSVKYMVLTFKTLCQLADFETAEEELEPIEGMQQPSTQGVRTLKRVLPAKEGMTINLNVQLVLPTTEDVSIYDAIFESLRRHLFDRDENDE